LKQTHFCFYIRQPFVFATLSVQKHQAYLSKPDEHRVDAMLLPLDQQLDAFASRFAYTRATLSDHLSVFTLTTC